jgi:hypothetical protein
MLSPADWIIIILIFLYVYWVGPALVLLNWSLARYLGRRLSLLPAAAINLAVSLLLLGPMRSRSGGLVFGGETYYPWYLDVSELKLDNVPWLALLLLCTMSVVITVATLSNPKLKLARENAQSDKQRMP